MLPTEIFFFNTWSTETGCVVETRMSEFFVNVEDAARQHEQDYGQLLVQCRSSDHLVHTDKSLYKYRVETQASVYEGKILSFDLNNGDTQTNAFILKQRAWSLSVDNESRPLLDMTFHYDWPSVLVAAAVEAYARVDSTDGRPASLSVTHDQNGLPTWLIKTTDGPPVTVEVIARRWPGNLSKGLDGDPASQNQERLIPETPQAAGDELKLSTGREFVVAEDVPLLQKAKTSLQSCKQSCWIWKA